MQTTVVDALEPPTRVGGAPKPRSPLRRHLNLTVELAITQFKLKYTGSVLGYLWSLFKPLMLFGIMYAVFVYLFKVGGTSTTNFGMQLLLGIVVWTFFAESTGTATGSIASNGHLIRKAFFPRIILVIASSMTALMTFFINLLLIVAVAAPFGRLDLGARSLVAPLVLIELYALALGVSLLLASLFVFYRDLGHLWEIFMQVLFYGSAVVFPFSLLHNHVLITLVAINPLAQIIEDLRHALITPDVPWASTLAGSLYFVPLLIVATTLIVGYRVFGRLTPRFAESL